MDRALVVGLGFISTNLALRLVEENFEVHITHRGLRGSKALMARDLDEKGVFLHRVDPLDEEAIVGLLRDVRPSYVFNAVGTLRGSRLDLWLAHVEVPRSLARAILAVDKSTMLIHLSASSINSPSCCTSADSSDFNRSKCYGERVLADMSREGLRFISVRPTLVYGYYNDHPEFLLLYRLVSKGIVPLLTGRVSAIYSRYLAELLVKLTTVDDFEGRCIYVTECGTYELRLFAELMAKAIGKRGFKLPVPHILIKPLAHPQVRFLLRYINIEYDCSVLRKLLGHVEPGIARGVEEMIRWIRRVEDALND